MRNVSSHNPPNNMLIAQVCPRYHPDIGGVNTHVKEISERLTTHGIHVEVLTTTNRSDIPDHETINGVRVRRFKSWSPHDSYHYSPQLSRYLKDNSERYSLIHAHSYHAFPAYHALKNRGSVNLVFTPHYHGRGHTRFRSLMLKLYKSFGKQIFLKSDKVIAVSDYEREMILRDFDVGEGDVEVIPNGINKEEFKGITKDNDGQQMILSVGRLEKYKGMQHLVQVMPLLSQSIKLEIVGKGPYQHELSSLIEKLELIERVQMNSDLPRKELLQKYRDASLFALLSSEEAYGICVAEALASRTPCIVANASALSEWVDGANCFGVELPIKTDTLKSLIESTIGRTVGEVELMDWDDVSKRLIKIYDEATQDRRDEAEHR